MNGLFRGVLCSGCFVVEEWFSCWSECSEHEMNRGDFDVGFARRDGAFVGLAVSPAAAVTGVGASITPRIFRGVTTTVAARGE